MEKLTVIHKVSRDRKIVDVLRADSKYRLVIRWPNGAGQYTFDVLKNRMIRGSIHWEFLEPTTAKRLWHDMRTIIESRVHGRTHRRGD